MSNQNNQWEFQRHIIKILRDGIMENNIHAGCYISNFKIDADICKKCGCFKKCNEQFEKDGE